MTTDTLAKQWASILRSYAVTTTGLPRPDGANVAITCGELRAAADALDAQAERLRTNLPGAGVDPCDKHVWFGVDELGEAWWRFDTVMDGAATASYAVLPDAYNDALDAKDAEIARLQGHLRQIRHNAQPNPALEDRQRFGLIYNEANAALRK